MASDAGLNADHELVQSGAYRVSVEDRLLTERFGQAIH
jgi:hypothetical protein